MFDERIAHEGAWVRTRDRATVRLRLRVRVRRAKCSRGRLSIGQKARTAYDTLAHNVER